MPRGNRKIARRDTLTFRTAVDKLSREDRFRATISAMNTLLIQKGIYTQEEFETLFCQWATAAIRRESTENSPALQSAAS